MNTPFPPMTTPPVPQYTPGDTGNDPSEPRLLDQVRAQIRLRHYSIRTESQYVQWVKRFVLPKIRDWSSANPATADREAQ